MGVAEVKRCSRLVQCEPLEVRPRTPVEPFRRSRFTGARPSHLERLQGRFDVLQKALNLIALCGTDILLLQPL
jgi:hypothetical protein